MPAPAVEAPAPRVSGEHCARAQFASRGDRATPAPVRTHRASPRLKPWPATGCSACAALPSSTTRSPTTRSANSSDSGNVRRSVTRVEALARACRTAARDRARNSASGSATSARPGPALRSRRVRSDRLPAAAPSGRPAVKRSKAMPSMRLARPDLRDQRDLAVVVARARAHCRPRLAAAVGDRGEARLDQLDRRAIAFARSTAAYAGVPPTAVHGDAVLDCGCRARASAASSAACKRAIADDVAERGQPDARRRARRAMPKPPRCEMSMSVIGVTAPGVAASVAPDAEALEDRAARRATARASDRRAAIAPAGRASRTTTSRSPSRSASASVAPTGPAPTMTTSCNIGVLACGTVSARTPPRRRRPSSASRRSGFRCPLAVTSTSSSMRTPMSQNSSGTLSAGRM